MPNSVDDMILSPNLCDSSVTRAKCGLHGREIYYESLLQKDFPFA